MAMSRLTCPTMVGGEEPLLPDQCMYGVGAGMAAQELTGGQNQPFLEEMAWNILMQPPTANLDLMSDRGDMGCPYGMSNMTPNLSRQVWADPD